MKKTEEGLGVVCSKNSKEANMTRTASVVRGEERRSRDHIRRALLAKMKLSILELYSE